MGGGQSAASVISSLAGSELRSVSEAGQAVPPPRSHLWDQSQMELLIDIIMRANVSIDEILRLPPEWKDQLLRHHYAQLRQGLPAASSQAASSGSSAPAAGAAPADEEPQPAAEEGDTPSEAGASQTSRPRDIYCGRPGSSSATLHISQFSIVYALDGLSVHSLLVILSFFSILVGVPG